MRIGDKLTLWGDTVCFCGYTMDEDRVMAQFNYRDAAPSLSRHTSWIEKRYFDIRARPCE